jgi:hypothetical protein
MVKQFRFRLRSYAKRYNNWVKKKPVINLSRLTLIPTHLLPSSSDDGELRRDIVTRITGL